MAQMLSTNASHNFFDEQADRFEMLSGPESPLPTDPIFRERDDAVVRVDVGPAAAQRI
jgi:hypothetical protein